MCLLFYEGEPLSVTRVFWVCTRMAIGRQDAGGYRDLVLIIAAGAVTVTWV